MDLKSRENPVILKLESAEFKNILTPEVTELKRLFDKYQYEIRVAGGAVRYVFSYNTFIVNATNSSIFVISGYY